MNEPKQDPIEDLSIDIATVMNLLIRKIKWQVAAGIWIAFLSIAVAIVAGWCAFGSILVALMRGG